MLYITNQIQASSLLKDRQASSSPMRFLIIFNTHKRKYETRHHAAVISVIVDSNIRTLAVYLFVAQKSFKLDYDDS